jgi:hypothetical protein
LAREAKWLRNARFVNTFVTLRLWVVADAIQHYKTNTLTIGVANL